MPGLALAVAQGEMLFFKVMCEEHVDKQIPDVGPTDKIDGPCVICLEDTVTNPVTLECGHVFCFGCIGTA